MLVGRCGSCLQQSLAAATVPRPPSSTSTTATTTATAVITTVGIVAVGQCAVLAIDDDRGGVVPNWHAGGRGGCDSPRSVCQPIVKSATTIRINNTATATTTTTMITTMMVVIMAVLIFHPFSPPSSLLSLSSLSLSASFFRKGCGEEHPLHLGGDGEELKGKRQHDRNAEQNTHGRGGEHLWAGVWGEG